MIIGIIDVSDVKDDLEHFNGYLPQPILSYIDINKYYKHINNLKNRDVIYKKIREAQRYSFEENIKDLKKRE